MRARLALALASVCLLGFVPPKVAPPGVHPAEAYAVSPSDPVLGPRDAPVTVLLFSKLRCTPCKKVFARLVALQADYGADVRLVWKDKFADDGPDDWAAARLGRAVFLAGGDPLFFSFTRDAYASGPTLTKLAAWYGVPAPVPDATVDPFLVASLSAARALEVPLTPYYFVDGRPFVGTIGLDKVDATIAEHLRVARTLLAVGLSRAAVQRALVTRFALRPIAQAP